MKTAVIYWSFEGNTEMIAKRISEKLNCDIFKIKLEKENVPKSNFFKYFWGGKQVMMKESPEIEPLGINIDDYDVIFIGTPVWAFTYTPAIRSFLQKYSIKNKKIVLFCSNSGGIKNTFEDMKSQLADNEIISEFALIDPLKNVNDANLKIDEWLDSLKI